MDAKVSSSPSATAKKRRKNCIKECRWRIYSNDQQQIHYFGLNTTQPNKGDDDIWNNCLDKHLIRFKAQERDFRLINQFVLLITIHHLTSKERHGHLTVSLSCICPETLSDFSSLSLNRFVREIIGNQLDKHEECLVPSLSPGDEGEKTNNNVTDPIEPNGTEINSVGGWCRWHLVNRGKNSVFAPVSPPVPSVATKRYRKANTHDDAEHVIIKCGQLSPPSSG